MRRSGEKWWSLSRGLQTSATVKRTTKNRRKGGDVEESGTSGTSDFPVGRRLRKNHVDHRNAVEEDRRIREFSFDCCFPGDEKGARIMVLAGRERVTGTTLCSVVLVKWDIRAIRCDESAGFHHGIWPRRN